MIHIHRQGEIVLCQGHIQDLGAVPGAVTQWMWQILGTTFMSRACLLELLKGILKITSLEKERSWSAILSLILVPGNHVVLDLLQWPPLKMQIVVLNI